MVTRISNNLRNPGMVVLFMLFFFSGMVAFAHGGKDHEKKDTSEQAEQIKMEGENSLAITPDVQKPQGEGKVTAAFSHFPNLHPLLVHFPIVLLLLAALLAIANIVFLKKELTWIVTIFRCLCRRQVVSSPFLRPY